MPRYSRKSKRRPAEGQQLIEHLREGSCLGCLICPADHTDDDVREAWAISRDIVLREWIRERPGTRPWAWWAFDAPEPRRRERADGKVHPHDHALRKLHIAQSDSEDYWRRAYRLHFGLPGLYIMPFDEDLYRDFMRNGLHDRATEIFEPEWSFLVRHNLLLPEDSP